MPSKISLIEKVSAQKPERTWHRVVKQWENVLSLGEFHQLKSTFLLLLDHSMVLFSAFEFGLITSEIEKSNSAVCTQIWNNCFWKYISPSLLCNYGDTASGKASCRNLCSRDHVRKGWMRNGLEPQNRQSCWLLFSNFIVER